MREERLHSSTAISGEVDHHLNHGAAATNWRGGGRAGGIEGIHKGLNVEERRRGALRPIKVTTQGVACCNWWRCH